MNGVRISRICFARFHYHYLGWYFSARIEGSDGKSEVDPGRVYKPSLLAVEDVVVFF